jgi:PPOX class probable FMN-dependent enzyme
MTPDTDFGFGGVVATESELRDIVGTPSARSLAKQHDRLDVHDRVFIAHSPFLLIATSGADGRCDVSPKGDVPGFVQVLDDTHLVIPDRPGNNRLDGMRNVLVNPHIGLIFLVPGRHETLRVNGQACITRDASLLERCRVQGKTPLLGLGVAVDEVFLHCPKAFLRAHIWDAAHWPAADALPSMACVLFDQIRPDGLTVQDYERDIADANVRRLY